MGQAAIAKDLAIVIPGRQDAPGLDPAQFGSAFAQRYAQRHNANYIRNTNQVYLDSGTNFTVTEQHISSNGSTMRRNGKDYVLVQSYFEIPGEIKRHRSMIVLLRYMQNQIRTVSCVSNISGRDVTLMTPGCKEAFESELGFD